MRGRGAFGTVAIALLCAACASFVESPRIADGPIPELSLRLPPALLGRELALNQRLRIDAGGGTVVIDALLEADARSVRLALLAFERLLARLEWDGTTLTEQLAPGYPAKVSAESVLSDLTLTLWPGEAVSEALSEGWSLDTTATSRELRWRGQPALRVRYHGTYRWVIEHLPHGYRLEVDSVPIER
jgi:hypothetical protein